MTKTSIHPKKLERFQTRDNTNDYILRIDHEHVNSKQEPLFTDVVAFEWHSIITHDILGKVHMIYGMRAPVKHAWDAIDAFGKPDKAIRTDGSKFWIMNTYIDRETGKISRLEGGNSSPFTIIARNTPLSKEEI
jgi:hypothetical protein